MVVVEAGAPDVECDAADLIALIKLLADARQHSVQPPGIKRGPPVGRAWRLACPAASVRVAWVLPLWLNAVLEKVVGCRGLQLAGRLDVVVQAAIEASMEPV